MRSKEKKTFVYDKVNYKHSCIEIIRNRGRQREKKTPRTNRNEWRCGSARSECYSTELSVLTTWTDVGLTWWSWMRKKQSFATPNRRVRDGNTVRNGSSPRDVCRDLGELFGSIIYRDTGGSPCNLSHFCRTISSVPAGEFFDYNTVVRTVIVPTGRRRPRLKRRLARTTLTDHFERFAKKKKEKTPRSFRVTCPFVTAIRVSGINLLNGAR